jgi:acyl carrier protein
MIADTSFALEPNLESELLRLWNKFLNRSDLTIDDDFFESGGDSLLATELLIEVERLTQGTIPPSILFETGTVRRLAERLGRQESPTPQPAVRIGGEKGRLFHFFHGDFDTGGVSVPRLAAMLGPDRPILAIAPHGMDGKQVPASIEEMAADRLPLILEAQPRGPYVLGGHCNGALVAFETARLLVHAGHRVDLVVMIDPVVVSVRRSARLLLLALDLTKRAIGVAPDLRWHSLIFAWRRLAEIDNRSRQHPGRLTRLWNKSWAERLDAIGRLARSAGFRLWNSWWDAIGRRLGMARSAGLRLWSKSWTERWEALGRRLGMARSAGLRLWSRWEALGRRLGKGLRLVRSSGFKETPSLERGPAKPSVEETWEESELKRIYSRVMVAYHPSRLAVPVLYIALNNSGGGWRRMSPEIELIDIPDDDPGHHFLSGDSVETIVGRVRARLNALDASTRVSAGA